MQRTSNVNITEIRKIQDDISLKLDLNLTDIEQYYTFEHKKLLNTVDDHIEGCKKALKNQTINLERISNIMDSFEQRATKLGIENEEIEKNILILGQNNLSSSVSSNENENVAKVKEFKYTPWHSNRESEPFCAECDGGEIIATEGDFHAEETGGSL